MNPPSASAKALRNALTTYDLVDGWREMHPTTKDSKFYSAPHNSFTRIAYIFIYTFLLPSVISSDIKPISWSHHDAVLLTLSSFLIRGSDRSWSLNEDASADPGTQA